MPMLGSLHIAVDGQVAAESRQTLKDISSALNHAARCHEPGDPPVGHLEAIARVLTGKHSSQRAHAFVPRARNAKSTCVCIASFTLRMYV